MVSIRFEVEKFLSEVMCNACPLCECMSLWLCACACFMMKAESDVSGCLNDSMNDL